MAVDIRRLVKLTPYLMHLTYASSLTRIKRGNVLESAGRLMDQGGLSHLRRRRRAEMLHLQIGHEDVVLTDQRPLIEANIEFLDGWTLDDLVESLNQRVFFWRGRDDGLLKTNQGHYIRYDNMGENLVFLRVPFVDGINSNSERGPEFCKYNSGGARQHPAAGKSPRGRSTFVQAEAADFTVKDVQEVTFLDHFKLPMTTQVSENGWSGPWRRIDSV